MEQDKWVSSEVPPKENEWYMVCVNRDGKLIVITMLFLYQGGKFYSSQHDSYIMRKLDEAVIYYQPLPAPPTH